MSGNTNAAYEDPFDEREDTLIESQIDDLLQGMGASEDHEDVLNFLKKTGLKESLVARVHKAICCAELSAEEKVKRGVAPAETPPNPAAFDDPEPTSIQILEAAQSIQEQRAKDYDSEDGERSMANTVRAFNIITGREDDDRRLTESEGWEFMVLLKLVRDRSVIGGHKDSLLDAVSYAALMGEARLREDPPEYGADEDGSEY